MNYEIVRLEEKRIVGLDCTTSNSDPKMGEKIGTLWQNYHSKGIYQSIQNKVNEYCIGLYSDYTADGYTVTVGCEVSENENKELCSKLIPAGNYAKFSLKGNMVTVVQETWAKIWSMELARSYTGDFEEYLNADEHNAEINIYIALKE